MSVEELCTACRKGNIRTIKRILSLGGLDVNGGGVTPLMEAMHRNHPAIVTRLLAHPDIRLDCTSSNGLGPLHFACYGNSPSVIPVFGQDSRCTPAIINAKDRWGQTALMQAVDCGNLDCVKEMDKLEGTDWGTDNDKGETLLDVARNTRTERNPMVLQYLLDRNKSVKLFGIF
jgi:ankyrin repeat protein